MYIFKILISERFFICFFWIKYIKSNSIQLRENFVRYITIKNKKLNNISKYFRY